MDCWNNECLDNLLCEYMGRRKCIVSPRISFDSIGIWQWSNVETATTCSWSSVFVGGSDVEAIVDLHLDQLSIHYEKTNPHLATVKLQITSLSALDMLQVLLANVGLSKCMIIYWVGCLENTVNRRKVVRCMYGCIHAVDRKCVVGYHWWDESYMELYFLLANIL